MNGSVDIFVIGGGINGVSVARDAAGRGFSVVLAEMNDLASGTSSAATKLVHGGLRYLEHYAFRLVHEALAEREVLWASAPHIIKPLRFVLPHHKGLRPALMLRAGLAMYDHMGGRRLLPPARTLDLTRHEVGEPLKSGYRLGFEYSDCWVDDARFVVLNARDAADRGAVIYVRNKVTRLRREAGGWVAELNGESGNQLVRARLVVNAAGPWADEVIAKAMGEADVHNIRLVQGSHIVVHRLYDHDRCYIFQNADGRIIFAIPYEDDFTLIGTTDQDYHGDPGDVKITDAETDYLLSAAGTYFAKLLTRDQIVWSYSGVRSLFDDGSSAAQEATRDYVLKVTGDTQSGAVIHVFGGKLTTSRRLAESVLEKVEQILGRKGLCWTRTGTLPGGDFAPLAFDAQLRRLGKDYPGMPSHLLQRLLRQYGTKSVQILGQAQTVADLGLHFGWTLYAAEVDYLVAQEWARTAEDILWRRTKTGLRVTGDEVKALEAYLSR